jgi:GWxTD domain-containing protein
MFLRKFNRQPSPTHCCRSLAAIIVLAFVAASSIALTIAIAPTPTFAAQGKQKLDKHYKEWLEHDVVYIITKDERERFTHLPNDEERDKFIKDFWEVRNPVPGSEVNTYKEEFYKRLAFADSRFGVGSGSDGWRTDRGRTYITLGAPQQKEIHRGAANLRAFEIWFYANVTPILPNAFYVMFYDKDGANDYRFYSPYLDGPDKLTTGVEAINSPSAGLKMIESSVGFEVARISLSLIPGEPVDLSNPQPSLTSDVMLMMLKGLSEQPAYRDDIHRKWMNREQVSTSMILQGHNLDLVLLPVRDDHGISRLDYSLGLKSPSDLSVAPTKDDRLMYNVQIRVQVFDRDSNKLIFVTQKDLRDTFDKRRYQEIKDKTFAYEGMLPLPSGNYRLAFQFTDWNKNVSYRIEREALIPKIDATQFQVPGILPFASAEQVDPVAAPVLPFTLAGVHFVPLSTSNLLLSNMQNFQVAYQVWTSPKNPALGQDSNLQIEYGMGQPSIPGSAKSIKDSASLKQFDPGGSLVNGKKLSLDGNSGNYILTLAITAPGSGAASFAKLNFRAVDAAALPPAPWVVIDPTIRDDMEKGVFDRNRGLCYMEQGLAAEGRPWLRRALALDHSDELARAHLVEAYYSQQDYRAVAALYKDTGITDAADAHTLLRIATSLRKLEKETEGLNLLKHGTEIHSGDPAMYVALADFYTQMGDSAKASTALAKSKEVIRPN